MLNQKSEERFSVSQLSSVRRLISFRRPSVIAGSWRGSQLSDASAKLIIYRAFIEATLEVPRHLARSVHDLYFNPKHEEFASRNIWSLSNAFTSAFKELEPIPQYRATGKLAGFLKAAAV